LPFITIRGVDKGAITGLNSIISKAQTAIPTALENAGKQGLEVSKATVPVKTGYLRSSLFSQVTSTKLAIGGRANYTIYQEFGTRRGVRPHRFVTRGAEKAMQVANQEIAKVLKL